MTPERRSAALVASFMRTHPVRTIALVLLLLGSGLAEAVGIGMLLPLLETTTSGGAASPDTALGRAVLYVLDLLALRPTLGTLLALIVAALAVKAAFRWLAMREAARAITRFAGDLRRRLIRALAAARWSHFVGVPIGRFANAVSIDALRASLAYHRAASALAAAVELAIYALLAVLISWRVAVLAVLVGGGIMAALGGIVRAARRAGEERTRVGQNLVARLTDVLQGFKPLKGMARGRALVAWLDREAGRLETAERRQLVAAETLRVLHEPVLAALLAAGLYAAITWGDQRLAPLLVMAFLFHRIASRSQRLQAEYQGMVSDESAFWSLDALARGAGAAAEPEGGAPPPRPSRAITFDAVTFGYGDAEPVLRDVHLEIPAGGCVLLVGRSGAGKTTLLDLIVGLHSPRTGAVRVDGLSLDGLDAAAWRRRIGYVPQETVLLHDTIARNIAMGDDAFGPEDVERALRAAAAWDFVAALPAGLETPVGERGLRLSGGQRRRLALARALVHDPSLLVLDEPLADVDAETGAAIRETLRQLRGRVTIVVASHQAGLEPLADAVYTVEAGQVRPAVGAAAGERAGTPTR